MQLLISLVNELLYYIIYSDIKNQLLFRSWGTNSSFYLSDPTTTTTAAPTTQRTTTTTQSSLVTGTSTTGASAGARYWFWDYNQTFYKHIFMCESY